MLLFLTKKEILRVPISLLDIKNKVLLSIYFCKFSFEKAVFVFQNIKRQHCCSCLVNAAASWPPPVVCPSEYPEVRGNIFGIPDLFCRHLI